MYRNVWVRDDVDLKRGESVEHTESLSVVNETYF